MLKFYCSFETFYGELDENEGSGKLPGFRKVSDGEDAVAAAIVSDGNGPFPERLLRIEAASVKEVFVEREEDLFKEAILTP